MISRYLGALLALACGLSWASTVAAQCGGERFCNDFEQYEAGITFDPQSSIDHGHPFEWLVYGDISASIVTTPQQGNVMRIPYSDASWGGFTALNSPWFDISGTNESDRIIETSAKFRIVDTRPGDDPSPVIRHWGGWLFISSGNEDDYVSIPTEGIYIVPIGHDSVRLDTSVNYGTVTGPVFQNIEFITLRQVVDFNTQVITTYANGQELSSQPLIKEYEDQLDTDLEALGIELSTSDYIVSYGPKFGPTLTEEGLAIDIDELLIKGPKIASGGALALDCLADVLPSGWSDCSFNLEQAPQGKTDQLVLNVHFNSDVVSKVRLGDLQSENLATSPQFVNYPEESFTDDLDDLDGNPATDFYLRFVWMTPYDSDAEFPVDVSRPLGTVLLDVRPDATPGSSVDIGISSESMNISRLESSPPQTATIKVREPNTCTGKYVLEPGEWAQISLPCLPPDGSTLADLFGDDNLGVFNTDWVAWRYLPEINNYEKVFPDSEVEYGVAYWIMSLAGSTTELDTPLNSLPMDASSTVACPHDETRSCYEFQLPRWSEGVSWSMIGIPADAISNIAGWRLSMDNSACSLLCTLDEAAAVGLTGDSVYTMRRGAYRAFDSSDVSQPWAGYWVGTLQAQPDQATRLYVPMAI